MTARALRVDEQLPAARLVEAIPLVVLGGAGLVMFGMVAATGARILAGVDFQTNRHNLFVVAVGSDSA